jgi:hypothetical protein
MEGGVDGLSNQKKSERLSTLFANAPTQSSIDDDDDDVDRLTEDQRLDLVSYYLHYYR